MNDFKVLPDDLDAHARSLDGLADAIKGLVSGGASTPGQDAFGFIGQFFATGAQQQAENASRAIGGTGDATTNVADAVRACARDYDETDRGNSDQLGRLQH
ncbi:type VII secretion target [Bounagaea algeriensis]